MAHCAPYWLFRVDLIATVCINEGPTCECRDVLEVAIVDYGGADCVP